MGRHHPAILRTDHRDSNCMALVIPASAVVRSRASERSHPRRVVVESARFVVMGKMKPTATLKRGMCLGSRVHDFPRFFEPFDFALEPGYIGHQFGQTFP